MALNDFLLSKEECKDLSNFTNTIIFFWALIAFLFCILIAVCMWPEGGQMFSQTFWNTMFVFPLGISTFVGAALVGYREMGPARANRESADLRAAAMGLASRPLALLGGAYRYTTSPDGDAIDPIANGALEITTRKVFDDARMLSRGRWFETFHALPTLPKGLALAEHDRHKSLTEWLLEELLKDLAPQIAAMPSSVKCVAYLYFSNRLHRSENLKCWENVASYVLLRLFPNVYQESDAAGLVSLDGWLDDAISNKGDEARVIIAIQLRSVKAPPWFPDGGTEAASALLLMPDAVAQKHGLKKQSDLHRPVTSEIETHGDSIKLAMRMAGTTGKRLAKIWQTGISSGQSESLSIMRRETEMATPVIDIDRTVGKAGIAASWFAVACAHASLRQHGGAQMVTAGNGNKLSTLVLKPSRKRVDSLHKVDG